MHTALAMLQQGGGSSATEDTSDDEVTLATTDSAATKTSRKKNFAALGKSLGLSKRKLAELIKSAEKIAKSPKKTKRSRGMSVTFDDGDESE